MLSELSKIFIFCQNVEKYFYQFFLCRTSANMFCKSLVKFLENFFFLHFALFLVFGKLGHWYCLSAFWNFLYFVIL